VKCEKCGAEGFEGDIWCNFCGHVLSESKEVENEKYIVDSKPSVTPNQDTRFWICPVCNGDLEDQQGR